MAACSLFGQTIGTIRNFYTSAQLYAQHITAQGDALWEKDGIAVCELQVNQQQPDCIPDGNGGFIVTWWDERNIFADIYAQPY